MTSLRKTSLTAGVLYLITFISIPTLFMYGPVKDPTYVWLCQLELAPG